MERIYELKEKKNLGCCNLVIWDFLVVAITVGFLLHQQLKLHTLFSILIGIAVGLVFVTLMGIKYIGKVFQLLCAVFWALIFWSIIDAFFPYKDSIWKWGILIILIIICTLLHFVSALEVLGENEKFNFSDISINASKNGTMTENDEDLQLKYECEVKRYRQAVEENEQVMIQAQNVTQKYIKNDLYNLMLDNNNVWSEGTARLETYFEMIIEIASSSQIKCTLIKISDLIDSLQASTKKVVLEINRILSENAYKEKASNSDVDESLFAGCKDKESLTKRYKNLMRTFHPDNSDGDSAMTIKIKNTYDELLKKL